VDEFLLKYEGIYISVAESENSKKYAC